MSNRLATAVANVIVVVFLIAPCAVRIQAALEIYHTEMGAVFSSVK